MDTEELRTFVEIADAGGVSAAAVRLGISKSVVSRRLARLEAELGVQLLARSTRGTSLTESGRSFRDHAARASAEMEMAVETIRHDNQLRGRLRVAVPLCDGSLHFTPVLANMAHRYPELQIAATYGDRGVDLISEGFDCAIRVGSLCDSSLIARKVGSLCHKLVASPDYIALHGAPETLHELAVHKALVGTELWRFKDREKIITFQPEGRFKADDSNALANAALAGLGVAYLSDSITYRHLASGALVPVMNSYPVPAAGVYVLRSNSPHTTRKVHILSDLLAKSFREHQNYRVVEGMRSPKAYMRNGRRLGDDAPASSGEKALRFASRSAIPNSAEIISELPV